MSKIVVIGSSNTDLIAKVNEFPKSGETIRGVSYFQAMGGKGANQALATHRLGGDIKFITCVGKDTNGVNALEYYKNEGLDASLSFIDENASSGVALIWVNERGENSIVVISGANDMLSPDYIHEIKSEILEADLIVMQMEIPYNTVKTVCDLAYENNKKVLLNVAPASKLDADIIKKIDILVVNETEAETISGKSMQDVGEEAIVDSLLALGAETIVLTLGKRGSIIKNKETYKQFPAFEVHTVDTTAAGDTFCGALAAELARGSDWDQAIEFATAAAAICVTKMGAQPSIPHEKEVRSFLNNLNL